MTGRILSTSVGTNQKAFTVLDWVLFGSVSFIWGSSFLLMAIGLDNFDPGLVTWLRVGSGAAVLLALPVLFLNVFQHLPLMNDDVERFSILARAALYLPAWILATTCWPTAVTHFGSSWTRQSMPWNTACAR